MNSQSSWILNQLSVMDRNEKIFILDRNIPKENNKKRNHPIK